MIQLSRHRSSSAGLIAAKIALNRSCDAMPFLRSMILDLAKPRALRLRKLRDSREVIRAKDHGADRDHDEGHERLGDLSGSRIR